MGHSSFHPEEIGRFFLDRAYHNVVQENIKKFAMKKLLILLHLLLLFPLLTNFSQAASIAVADCNHCNKLYSEPKAECCTVVVQEKSGECHSQQPEEANCPHGGFCQDDYAVPAVTATPTSGPAEAAALSSAGNLPYNCISHSCKISAAGIASPPGKKSSIYLFHCSFLI